MNSKYCRAALLAAGLLCTALPAMADYFVVWSNANFNIQTGSETSLCVGDMIGNGQLVMVGRNSNSTEVRDALTGALIHQFGAYEALGVSYTMIDLDNDGSMECLVAHEGSTSLIDWVIIANAETPDFDERSQINFSLHPNPARPGATVAYTLTGASRVELSVYSVSGRRVRQLVDELQATGPREVRWDGRDDAGIRLASGTYLVELRIDGERTASSKSVLLR